MGARAGTPGRAALATTLAAAAAFAQPRAPTLEACLQNAQRFMPGSTRRPDGSRFELTRYRGCALVLTEHLAGPGAPRRVYTFDLRDVAEVKRPSVAEAEQAPITIEARAGAALRVTTAPPSVPRAVPRLTMLAVGVEGYLVFWNLDYAQRRCARP